MFKKLVLLPAAIVAICSMAIHAAEVSVAIKNVPVTASIMASNTLTHGIFNVSDDKAAATIAFGAITTAPFWGTLAPQYVRLSVSDNAVNGWRLRIYSDNYTTAPSTTIAYSFGGLKGLIPGSKVNMAWMVLPNTVLPPGPGVGDPSTGTVNGWTYLKDKADYDDPATTIYDESFAGSDKGGYNDIAFGAPTYTRIVRPNSSGGNAALETVSSNFYLYFEADFSSAGADTYSATLKIELINL